MPAGHRIAREERRSRARSRSVYPEEEALVAACQALLDSWPWLTDQYRQNLVPELPIGPMGAAIQRYLECAGE